MDHGLPCSSVHGIFQAGILEWVAISFSNDKPRQHIKGQRHYFADKGLYTQSHGFSSSHVWMYELDHKEGWALKSWTVVLGKTLESPLDSKEIKLVNPKGNQHWIFIGKTDAEAPILWPPDVKSQLTGKDPDAGKDWRQKEKGEAEDEIVRSSITNSTDMRLSKLWQLVEDQGDKCATYSPWGCKESAMTEQLNNKNRLIEGVHFFYITGSLAEWTSKWKHVGESTMSALKWSCKLVSYSWLNISTCSLESVN